MTTTTGPITTPYKIGTTTIIIIIVILAAITVGAYNAGINANNRPPSTQTISSITTTTTTSTTTTSYTSQTTSTLTQTITQTISNIYTSFTTITNSYSTTSTTTSTTTTTTTTTSTKTLGIGLLITNYKLFITNAHKDTIIPLNLTVALISNIPTSITETTYIILTPTGGNANDIKFVPNPITIQVSQLETPLTIFAILDHTIVSGTYIIQYIISTSTQGSVTVFTVLEVT